MENPEVLPRNFDLGGFRRDMALDALHPTMNRLERLHARTTDTHMALGSAT